MYKCFNFFSCNNYLSNWCLPINYVWISTCFYFLYYWKSRIWNLSGRKSLWIIVLSKLLLVLWHCQHTTDGIYILTRLETSHPGNYLYWYSNISRSVLCSAHRSAFNNPTYLSRKQNISRSNVIWSPLLERFGVSPQSRHKSCY